MTFAAELRKAVATRGVRGVDVWRPAGINRSTWQRVLQDKDIPSMDTAERLADQLDWPRLVTVAAAARTKPCVVCGAAFLAASKAERAKYCSHACASLVHARRERDAARVRTLTDTRLVRKRLADHQAAVARFCRRCADHACPDAKCELRDLSPLPLARRRVG